MILAGREAVPVALPRGTGMEWWWSAAQTRRHECSRTLWRGIRGATLHLDKRLEDLVPILTDKRDLVEANTEFPANLLSILSIFLGACGIALLLGIPVGHMHPNHIVALTFQQERSHCRIHTA